MDGSMQVLVLIELIGAKYKWHQIYMDKSKHEWFDISLF